MHRISGWPNIRPDNPAFFYIRCPTGYRIWQPDIRPDPVIEKAGYPAKYEAKEKHLNTAYNILQSFDFM